MPGTLTTAGRGVRAAGAELGFEAAAEDCCRRNGEAGVQQTLRVEDRALAAAPPARARDGVAVRSSRAISRACVSGVVTSDADLCTYLLHCISKVVWQKTHTPGGGQAARQGLEGSRRNVWFAVWVGAQAVYARLLDSTRKHASRAT